ncbi:MAG: copR [Chthoniobacteraceae bacterium]|nr:copR [Chthoniobacteraceae bacterium]
MKILVADDDGVTRILLKTLLEKDGHNVIAVSDGVQAMEQLRKEDPPRLAILDWEMSPMDGMEVSRRVREGGMHIYLLMLTSRTHRDSVIKGLSGGADDYITKPFDHEELRARIRIGERIISLQTSLAAQLAKAQKALAQIQELKETLNVAL